MAMGFTAKFSSKNPWTNEEMGIAIIYNSIIIITSIFVFKEYYICLFIVTENLTLSHSKFNF